MLIPSAAKRIDALNDLLRQGNQPIPAVSVSWGEYVELRQFHDLHGLNPLRWDGANIQTPKA